MKNLAIATTLLLSTTTVASADPLAFVGGLEYAVEAETLETTLGVEVTPLANFTLTPAFVIGGQVDDLDITELKVTASYSVLQDLDLYATVSADKNVNYTEAVVGVAFKF